MDIAFLLSLILTVAFFALSLFRVSKEDDGLSVGILAVAAVITFAATFGMNSLIFYFGMPALVGPYGGWLLPGFVNLAIALIVFGAFSGGKSLAVWIFGIFLALWLLHAGFQACVTPRSDAEAKYLTQRVNIQEMETGLYPDTDSDHILAVPFEAALFQAKQIVSSATDKEGRNLSTVYEPDYGALQSINHHLYWVFQLKFTGWLVSNQTANRIVPGYIVVDAEDPGAQAQLKLGYKMQYTRGSFFRNRIERHIYNNGYRNWEIDDLTIEIRDDWKPFFTASLNRPALRFLGSVPEKMIIIDPENGDIEEYPLDKIPEWVDRVYAEDVVNEFMTWWGRWSNAPWKLVIETTANRMKPAGKPHIVYTKGGHPMWQVLMTSQNKDTSAMGIVLFEGRTNTAKIYKVPGISTEPAVIEAFKMTAKNLKNLKPVHPSIHKIYGELSWVVSYISPDTVDIRDSASSFKGLGIVSAFNVQGANVVMTDHKAQALAEYRQILAQGKPNIAPEENSLTKTAEGVITDVGTADISGYTNFFLKLDTDKAHIFQGKFDDRNPELPFVKQGTRVRIKYLDVGKQRVDIMSYEVIK